MTLVFVGYWYDTKSGPIFKPETTTANDNEQPMARIETVDESSIHFNHKCRRQK